MKTTGKSKRKRSSGDSTPPDQEPMSGSTLCRQVIGQAVKDAARGSEKEQAEVVRWLVSPDFIRICEGAAVNPEDWRIRIALLFRSTPGLRLYYAKKMLDELNH